MKLNYSKRGKLNILLTILSGFLPCDTNIKGCVLKEKQA